ncbi:uncharacterized protein LOC116139232 [Pistacia vera]|uniref:uncharacterized protein LOC116138291 n=1 Tax=Pistacia vera TaxID=55513 RepID=UPI001263C4F6|nr:uncharacterized protein LOC116138291 [Pistacia vera]XP_031280765.1 uncharacterized protein LOC116139232 [Pistacia vera]
MEGAAANQLPEVDSLPDGFVDSPTEALAPATPTLEQENSLGDYKDEGFVELDHSNESTHELASEEFQTSKGRTEKTQKLRTFPVPLSEMDNFDASVDLIKMPNKGSVEETDGMPAMPTAVASVSEASAGISGCSEVKGQVQGECQNTKRCNYIQLECNFLLFLLNNTLHISVCGCPFYLFIGRMYSTLT